MSPVCPLPDDLLCALSPSIANRRRTGSVLEPDLKTGYWMAFYRHASPKVIALNFILRYDVPPSWIVHPKDTEFVHDQEELQWFAERRIKLARSDDAKVMAYAGPIPRETDE